MRRFVVGSCDDPLGLWYVERQEQPISRRYFSAEAVARLVAAKLEAGLLDWWSDVDFHPYV